MESVLERELKLDVDGDVDLTPLGGSELPARRFTSTYYDTADRRLLRLGITLRRRLENGRNVWQAKLPREGARQELEEEPGGAAGPPARIAGLLAAVLRGAELEEVAVLRTHRAGLLVDGVATTVDDVEVLEGRRVVQRFTEVEAELVDGSPAALERVGRRLRELGLTPSREASKLVRVVGDAPRPRAPRRASTLDLVRSYLGAQVDDLLRHDPGARIGDDPEDVHAMRVAVRRLRSALRTVKPLLEEEWVDGLRSELDWLAQALGAVRDADVLRMHLEAEIATLDAGDALTGAALTRALVRRGDQAQAELLDVLASERYLALLDAVEAASVAPHVRELDVRPLDLVEQELRALRKAVRRLPADARADALHHVRIRGKRTRYAAELAGQRGGKRAGAFVEAAKELQDVLGEHQDAVVAIGVVRELAREAPTKDVARVAGRLIEREHQRRDAARMGFPRAWKRLRRRGEAWLD